jgi:[lysine-biosynthesis-protein LysW]--L-2-aminoadipate ligase
MRVGFLASVVRVEEKLLLAELRRRPGVEIIRLSLRELVIDPDSPAAPDVDIALLRTIGLYQTLAAARVLEHLGVPCLNRAEVIAVCGNKMLTSLALQAAGVPQPGLRLALSGEAAISAMDELGYPVVLKPAVGSWGRLISRICCRDAAEAVLEHRAAMGPEQSSLYYVQQLVATGGRDVRAFVVGGRCIAAIYRTSDHWITNTARGATVTACEVSPDLAAIAEAAAAAVGGGMVAIDLFETEEGWLVNEVNHGMEFRNSIEPTGVDIASSMVDHVLAAARGAIHG